VSFRSERGVSAPSLFVSIASPGGRYSACTLPQGNRENKKRARRDTGNARLPELWFSGVPTSSRSLVRWTGCSVSCFVTAGRGLWKPYPAGQRHRFRPSWTKAREDFLRRRGIPYASCSVRPLRALPWRHPRLRFRESGAPVRGTRRHGGRFRGSENLPSTFKTKTRFSPCRFLKEIRTTSFSPCFP